MRYRPEIDGLRALAVLPVILFHAGVSFVSGGFVGVDVFFVISGYLITAILLGELAAGNFSIVRFYERRARRILPALFFVMLACLPFAWFWMWPGDLHEFSKSLIYVSSFASNYLFYKQNYFDSATELKPLLHTWSLAVEEQYYLFFPPLLWLCWRYMRRFIPYIFAVSIIASLAYCEYRLALKPEVSYYMLSSRFWELATGAWLAYYHYRHAYQPVGAPYLQQAGSATGLLLILYAALAFSEATRFPGIHAVVPTVGAALILLFAHRTTFTGRLLASKPFVAIGLISYSAYLWHQPLFAFARLRGADSTTQPLLFLALVLATLALAVFSWRFIEAPFRNRSRVSRKWVLILSLAFIALFIGIGSLIQAKHDFIDRLSDSEKAIYAFRKYETKKIYREGSCFLTVNQTEAEFNPECAPQTRDAILIWGDSHAAALSYGLRTRYPHTMQYTASGCPPITSVYVTQRPHCERFNDFVVREITRLQPQTLLIHANWLFYDQYDPVTALGRTLAVVKRATPHTKIVVIGGVPQWHPSLPNSLLRNHMGLIPDQYLANPDLTRLQTRDAQLQHVAQEQNVGFVSASAFICGDKGCLVTATQEKTVEPIVFDYGHLTQSGSYWLAGNVLKQLR